MRNTSLIALVAALAIGNDSYGAGSCIVCPTGAFCEGGGETPVRCQAGTWLNYNKLKLYTSGPNIGKPMRDPNTWEYITEVGCDECPAGMICPDGATAPLVNATPPGSIIMTTEVDAGFKLREQDDLYPDVSDPIYGASPMPDCKNKTTMQGASITTKCPPGYLLADGSVLNIEDYPALFGVIGQTYGYDSTKKYKTFKLPDHRGRFLRMAGGAAAALGTAQASDNKSHTHTLSGSTGSGGASGTGTGTQPLRLLGSTGSNTTPVSSLSDLVSIAHPDAVGVVGMKHSSNTTGYIDYSRGDFGPSWIYSGSHTHTLSGNTDATGNSSEARPVNYSVLYYIKY